MSHRKPPENASEFLDGLIELLTDLPERTIEELEEDLREEGIYDEEFVHRVQDLVKTKLEEHRLAWLESARQEMSATLEKLSEAQPSSSPGTLEELKEKITLILSGRFGEEASKYTHIHFRKLDKVTENDLRSLLDDLESLDLLSQSPDAQKDQDE